MLSKTFLVVADFRVTGKVFKEALCPKSRQLQKVIFFNGVLQLFGTTWQVPNFSPSKITPPYA